MGIIGSSLTKGCKPAIFRNQPVHQFYSHLQAVLREIEPGGGLENLFARPYCEGADVGRSPEIKWMTDLAGQVIPFGQLPPTQKEIQGRRLTEALEKIRSYSQQRSGAGGIEKDYADFLRAVAVSPDLNRVVVVNDKLIILHWGFVPDGAADPNQVVFAGWDEFLFNIRRAAIPAPDQAPTPA